MIALHGGMNPYPSASEPTPLREDAQPSLDTVDAMEAYFECITTCSLEDGECVTRCVEQLRERN